MPSPTRVRPLPLDITAWLDSGIVSLSIELQPLRKADEVAALLLALRKFPEGLRGVAGGLSSSRVGSFAQALPSSPELQLSRVVPPRAADPCRVHLQPIITAWHAALYSVGSSCQPCRPPRATSYSNVSRVAASSWPFRRCVMLCWPRLSRVESKSRTFRLRVQLHQSVCVLWLRSGSAQPSNLEPPPRPPPPILTSMLTDADDDADMPSCSVCSV